MLQPVSGFRVVDVVRDQLRAAILTGELAPGTRLSVPELAKRLEVSRPPERDAVLPRVGDGLAVEHPSRRGAVAPLELADLLEIPEPTGAKESQSVQHAAGRTPTTQHAHPLRVASCQG